MGFTGEEVAGGAYPLRVQYRGNVIRSHISLDWVTFSI